MFANVEREILPRNSMQLCVQLFRVVSLQKMQMKCPPSWFACMQGSFFRWESRRSKSYFSFSAFCNFSLSVATASEMIPTHLEDIPSSMALAVSSS